MEQKFSNNSLDLEMLREFCKREGEAVTYHKGDQLEREWRYYFDENKRCIERLSNAEEIGDGYSEKVAADKYLQVFKILVDNEE